MSHFWHKPLNLAASAVVVASMLAGGAITATTVSANAVHNSASNITFSFDQFPDGLNAEQAGTVVDVYNDYLNNSNGVPLVLAQGNGQPLYAGITKPAYKNHGLTISFSLHKGMKWSNGDPMTNSDYVLGWKVRMNTGVCAGSCDNVKSISLHGKYGITLHMKRVYAAAVWGAVGGIPLLDTNWALNGVGGVTKHDITTCLKASASNNFAGCNKYAHEMEVDPALNYESSNYVVAGPYEVSNFANNSEITYKVDPNWTKSMPGGKPSIKQLTFLFYPSVPAMIAGAARKDTDLTTDYVLNNVGGPHSPGTLKSYKQFKTYVAGPLPEVLTFNQRNAVTNIEGQNAANGVSNPFVGAKGLKVRQALLLAFNRAKLIAASFAPVSLSVAATQVSYCSPITCSKAGAAPFHTHLSGNWDPRRGRYIPGACATSKKQGGDGRSNMAVKDALALLKSAGYGPKHHLHVYLSSTTAPWRLLEQGYLQQCWQALGSWVSVTTENIKSTHYFDTFANGGVLAVGHFEADIHGYGSTNPDPSGWLGNLRGDKCAQDGDHSSARANSDCFNDPVINNALNKGQATFSNSVRSKWYRVLTVEIAKKADWATIAPRPQIWTWDGIPKHGFSMDAWQNGPTWNVFKFKE
jgi:ABC-type transport system substrate-binding protein